MGRGAATLMLLGGAPGSGKSTLAARLAEERPLALALDIDVLKHSLGGWDEDLTRSGLQARRLAAAMIGQHLADGHDVLLGQYLARTSFIEQLEQLAADHGARFVEVVLVLEERTLAQRLQERGSARTGRSRPATTASSVRTRRGSWSTPSRTCSPRGLRHDGSTRAGASRRRSPQCEHCCGPRALRAMST